MSKKPGPKLAKKGKKPPTVPPPEEEELDKATESRNRLWYAAFRKEELRKLTERPAPDYELPIPLPPEEWDFRSCPKDELEMCLEYELSREVAQWRQVAFNYRQLSKEGKIQVELGECYGLSILFPYLNLTRFPEWPNKPWLALNPITRRENVKWHGWSSLYADTICLLNETPFPGANEVRKKFGKVIIYPRFQIDLTQMDATIKRAFSDYLEKFREKIEIKPVERRGTSTEVNVLKRLGAYRLLKVMKWNEAKEIFLDSLPPIKSYPDQPSWLRAKREAKKAINQFAKRGILSDILRSNA